MVYVDESLCVGCGVCAGACPTGAIRMVGNVAQVEQSLCRECEACMQACPRGAVLSLREPVRAGDSAPARVPESTPIPVQPPAQFPQPAAGTGSWLGAAFDFVGREIAPRVAAFLENRQQRYPNPVTSRAVDVPGRASYGGRGGGRGSGRQGRRRRRGRW